MSGLYPIKPFDVNDLKHALGNRSTTHIQWYARLGHPSSQVVKSILLLNNISFASDSPLPVCNACLLAKSLQLPYTSSFHRSLSPLELIIFGCLGSCTSICWGRQLLY